MKAPSDYEVIKLAENTLKNGEVAAWLYPHCGIKVMETGAVTLTFVGGPLPEGYFEAMVDSLREAIEVSQPYFEASLERRDG